MKFYYYTVILVGIILVLNLGGVTTPTVDAGAGLAKKLNLIDDNRNLTIQDVKNSDIWSKDTVHSSDNPGTGLKWILLVALVGGIVLGITGRAPDIRYITASFVFGIASLLLTDLIYLFTLVTQFDSWMRYGLGIIIGGLIAGFIITTLQFWQGTD